jgi:hypothetical protein
MNTDAPIGLRAGQIARIAAGSALAALATLTTGVAQADTAAVQRCRIVAEPAARLACYDAIALPGIGSRAGWGAPVGGAPAAASATAPAATAATATPANRFGLEGRAAEPAADQLESRILGPVESFPKGTRYRLENGQVWEITETALGFYQLDSPTVTITRGLLGSFFMRIDGVAAAPRVRRLQ